MGDLSAGAFRAPHKLSLETQRHGQFACQIEVMEEQTHEDDK